MRSGSSLAPSVPAPRLKEPSAGQVLLAANVTVWIIVPSQNEHMRPFFTSDFFKARQRHRDHGRFALRGIHRLADRIGSGRRRPRRETSCATPEKGEIGARVTVGTLSAPHRPTLAGLGYGGLGYAGLGSAGFGPVLQSRHGTLWLRRMRLDGRGYSRSRCGLGLGRRRRLQRGQRHSRSRCHRIEFTRDQHREVAGMMDVTGELPGAISSSPKDIGAGWTDDR